jgi:hypothetical protein
MVLSFNVDTDAKSMAFDEAGSGASTPTQNNVWSTSAGKAKARMNVKPAAMSIGSQGHPHACAKACKYFRRKHGCRDGANCSKCHQCHWSRDATTGKKEVPPPPPPFQEQCIPVWEAPVKDQCLLADEGVMTPSVGSIGHPHSCGQACKYHTKKAGCKDGKLCTRCHICRWSRSCATQAPAGKAAPNEDDGEEVSEAGTHTEPFNASPKLLTNDLCSYGVPYATTLGLLNYTQPPSLMQLPAEPSHVEIVSQPMYIDITLSGYS